MLGTMDADLTPAQMTAWRTFLEAHARVATRLERDLVAAHGISLAWYDVLVQLGEAPHNRLRMRELAAAVLLSRSGLTRLVDRMDAGGLVTRSPAPDDRRGVYVTLTDAGRARLREAAPTHLDGVRRYFAEPLSTRDMAAIARALDRIARG
jgi:DNA-binding MarR family transcriptional regulator